LARPGRRYGPMICSVPRRARRPRL